MEKKYISTDLDAFNRMFTQLANQSSTVCWMRSLDYQRQLYISPNFETIFGGTCESLYEHPESWNDFLLPIDSTEITETIDHRTSNIMINDGNNHMFFRIGSPDGGVRYIRDWSLLIHNTAGDPIAIAGIGENLSPEHWYTSLQKNKNSKKSQLPCGLTLNDIIEKEAAYQSVSLDCNQKKTNDDIKRVDCIKVNNLTIPLSKREADCLYHLRLGKSAKETARDLFISPRTVETHLDNIKQKAYVRTKLELISQLIPINTSIIAE